MIIGIEPSGNEATNRARCKYIPIELRKLGFNVCSAKENGEVDFRIVLSRRFSTCGEKGKFRVFDCSDAILIPPADHSLLKRFYQRTVVSRRIGKFVSECDAIVTACRAQQLSMQRYNRNVYVIPDSSYYHVLYDDSSKPDTSDRVIFVWDGQGHNFQYLEQIVVQNVDFFRRKDVLLRIVTDREDPLHGVSNEKRLEQHKINFEFLEWNINTFIQHVNSAHVGLAPVNLNCPHASAKPDNKMVNYQGLGLPVIGSTTMAYYDFSLKSTGDGVLVCKTNAEWAQALEYWRVNRNEARAIGRQGRRYVLDNYTPPVLAKKWKQIILDLTN